MLLFSDSPVFQCSCFPVFKHFFDPDFKCFFFQMVLSSDVSCFQMFLFSDVSVFRCSYFQMFLFSRVPAFLCFGFRLFCFQMLLLSYRCCYQRFLFPIIFGFLFLITQFSDDPVFQCSCFSVPAVRTLRPVGVGCVDWF